MNYLFVCKGNRDRSPTAERYCREKYGQYGHEFMSRGLGVKEPVYYKFNGHTSMPLTQEDLEWADEVWIMDEGLRQKMAKNFPVYIGNVIVLDISDNYDIGYIDDIKALQREIINKIEISSDNYLKLRK
jgi:predicted protein tyrosine phosphatase